MWLNVGMFVLGFVAGGLITTLIAVGSLKYAYEQGREEGIRSVQGGK